jgi:hypothetical protein
MASAASVDATRNLGIMFGIRRRLGATWYGGREFATGARRAS